MEDKNKCYVYYRMRAENYLFITDFARKQYLATFYRAWNMTHIKVLAMCLTCDSFDILVGKSNEEEISKMFRCINAAYSKQSSVYYYRFPKHTYDIMCCYDMAEAKQIFLQISEQPGCQSLEDKWNMLSYLSGKSSCLVFPYSIFNEIADVQTVKEMFSAGSQSDEEFRYTLNRYFSYTKTVYFLVGDDIKKEISGELRKICGTEPEGKVYTHQQIATILSSLTKEQYYDLVYGLHKNTSLTYRSIASFLSTDYATIYRIAKRMDTLAKENENKSLEKV